jgi:hypothetical protein
VYDSNRTILRCLLSDKLASGCGCLRALDAKRLIHNVVFAHLERAACRSPLAGDVPSTRQGSSFALSGMFYCVSAAVRMSRYPFLLYRQGPVPCVRPAGIAACSPASGLLRRLYPLACRSPLAGDVPATRQRSSFALSGMFYRASAAVRMSRYPFLLYRQGPVPCVRSAGIAACSPASGLLRRP